MNGGKIQYVKYPISYNKDAIITLIERAMDMGFYEGVNLSLSYCDDCGIKSLIWMYALSVEVQILLRLKE